ncbi:mitochondrial carrier [Meredithblackwellia eburnea MCA 4105]
MRITLSDRNPQDQSTSWFTGYESMLAGAGAGLVTSVVTCPLDVIKTKLQASGAQSQPPLSVVQQQSSTNYNKGKSRGVAGTCRFIWRNDGFRGFYRGLGPTIIGYLPTWAIYFTVYDKVKEHMTRIRGRGRDDPIAHVVAAMSAGASGTIVTNPLWVVKTRFMTQEVGAGEPRYRHTLDAIARIYRTEGPSIFYRGLLPSLIGVSHIAVQFPLYERLKVYNRPLDGSDISSSVILFCSSLSKMVASVATYPHEVLRTRLQIQKLNSANTTSGGSYEGVTSTFRRILMEEGYTGFYRGMGVNLIRTVPSSALTILTYEILMRKFASASSLST